MKIVILLGHPNKLANGGSFADSYEIGAREGGHEVRRVNVGDLKFDPILHKGYLEIQNLEPDLARVQEDIKWADHLVIIHPIWWGNMPALFKGFFERIWLPGFAYRFHKEGVMKGYLWDKLLVHKSAHIVVTMDNYPILARFLVGDVTATLRRAVLGFAGVWPIKVTKIGGMKFMSEAKKARWKRKMWRLGKKGI